MDILASTELQKGASWLFDSILGLVVGAVILVFVGIFVYVLFDEISGWFGWVGSYRGKWGNIAFFSISAFVGLLGAVGSGATFLVAALVTAGSGVVGWLCCQYFHAQFWSDDEPFD